MFKFLFYKIGQFIVNRLPIELSYRYGIFLSDLQYFCSFRDRRAVRNNLRTILQTDQNLEPMVREVFRNFGRYLVEFFRMARTLDKKYIEQNVKLKNIHYVQEALARGKGVIILSAHLGNWELGGVILGVLGYPVIAVALPHKERPVNDLFNQQRARGMAVVPTNIAVRHCIEALRNNKLVAIAADRDFSLKNGEVLDFLGRKAMIPKGAAIFSLKTGAAIVPCFCIRNAKDNFTFTFEEPLIPPSDVPDDKEAATILALMKTYTTIIEKKIKQFPVQWLMFREFWVA